MPNKSAATLLTSMPANSDQTGLSKEILCISVTYRDTNLPAFKVEGMKRWSASVGHFQRNVASKLKLFFQTSISENL